MPVSGLTRTMPPYHPCWNIARLSTSMSDASHRFLHALRALPGSPGLAVLLLLPMEMMALNQQRLHGWEELGSEPGLASPGA